MEIAIPSLLTLRTIPPLDSPHATYIKVLGRTRGCKRLSGICVCPVNCGAEVITISSLRECASARRDSATDLRYGRGGKPVGRIREDGASRSWAETQANANVNYSSLLNRMYLMAGYGQDRANTIIPHRRVIEPNV